MKTIALSILCLGVFLGSAFAENVSDDTHKDVNGPNTTHKSELKSSPRLSYHSNKSEDDNNLEKLKPMLKQFENNANGGMTPGGATMSF